MGAGFLVFLWSIEKTVGLKAIVDIFKPVAAPQAG